MLLHQATPLSETHSSLINWITNDNSIYRPAAVPEGSLKTMTRYKDDHDMFVDTDHGRQSAMMKADRIVAAAPPWPSIDALHASIAPRRTALTT